MVGVNLKKWGGGDGKTTTPVAVGSDGKP